MTVIEVRVSNPSHPEYGSVDLLLPIAREEYDSIIENVLKPLGIGDAIRDDCQVEYIESYYSILDELRGRAVNIDELDYLAKRLESFVAGEDAQFQGMADKMKLTTVKDFINLTFCCQKATVISNFEELESAGKDHVMNLHGGSMPAREYRMLDGEKIARDLIATGKGVISPYGVVFDNGMELEEPYRGAAFPEYLYETDTQLHVTVRQMKIPGVYCEAKLFLPMADELLKRYLLRAGITDSDIVEITAVEPLCLEAIYDSINTAGLGIGELNDITKELANVSYKDRDLFESAVQFAGAKTVAEMVHVAEYLDLFECIPDVQDEEDLGIYLVQDSERYIYDPELEKYYDYTGIGANYVIGHGVEFSQYGAVSYEGDQPLEEILTGSAEEQRLGGM